MVVPVGSQKLAACRGTQRGTRRPLGIKGLLCQTEQGQGEPRSASKAETRLKHPRKALPARTRHARVSGTRQHTDKIARRSTQVRNGGLDLTISTNIFKVKATGTSTILSPVRPGDKVKCTSCQQHAYITGRATEIKDNVDLPIGAACSVIFLDTHVSYNNGIQRHKGRRASR